jgi:hypothetical protein
MITADQLVAHAIGDYVLQSDWMASQKRKQFLVSLIHAIAYSTPFVWLAPTMSWSAWFIIVGTHALIDRFALARYVCWLKNFLSWPRSEEMTYILAFGEERPRTVHWWYPWSRCKGTGYPDDKPAWMAVWLLIITDNVMHVVINALALRYF